MLLLLRGLLLLNPLACGAWIDGICPSSDEERTPRARLVHGVNVLINPDHEEEEDEDERRREAMMLREHLRTPTLTPETTPTIWTTMRTGLTSRALSNDDESLMMKVKR